MTKSQIEELAKVKCRICGRRVMPFYGRGYLRESRRWRLPVHMDFNGRKGRCLNSEARVTGYPGNT